MSGFVECEFSTTLASEKSDATCAWMSATKLSAHSTNWASAAGRATPASVDSIPTSANQEDHVSMAAHAARRLLPMAANVASVLGIELLAAAQGCDFHAPLRSSPALEAVRAALRREVPGLAEDRFFAPDIAAATELVSSGAIAAAAGDMLPGLEPT